MIPHNAVSSALAVSGHQNRYPRRQYYPPSHRQRPTKDEFRKILMERMAEVTNGKER